MTALCIGTDEREQLKALAARAAAAVVDMSILVQTIHGPEVKAAHRAQMTAQSIVIPMGFLVTFSIESNHPCGMCRHMSMSAAKAGRLPHPVAIWMVAEELGFQGGLEGCKTWMEDLQGHGHAINVLQPLPA